MFSISIPSSSEPDKATEAVKPRRSPLLLSMILLGICGVTGFYSFLQFRKILDDTELLLNSIAIQKSQQISNWRSVQLIEAKEAGGVRELVVAVNKAIKTKDPQAISQVANEFDNFKESYGFHASTLLDRDLKPILSNAEGLELSSLEPTSSLRASCKQARDTGLPVMTDLCPLPGSGEPGIEIIIPLFDQIRVPSNHMGYIVQYIKAAKELYPVIESWPFSAGSGQSILLERIGGEIKVLGRLKDLPGSPFSSLPRSDMLEAFEPMLREKNGSIHGGRNYAGVESFAVARPVEGTDWILVSEVSRRETLGPWWGIFFLLATCPVFGFIALLLTDNNRILRVMGNRYQTLLETERRLRTAERKFLVFLDKMPSMAMIKDKDNRVLAANKAMEAHFPAEEWIGKTTEERLPPDQAKVSLEWDRKVLETGYVEFEETRMDKYGQLLHLFTQKFRIEGGDGAPLIGLIATDMTEQGRAERQIRELNATLEQKVKERTTQLESANAEFQSFAYAVSHDLGSPLRTMTEYADLLKDECFDSIDESGRKYLDSLRGAAARMAGLMGDIQEMSQISNAELKIEDVDIGKIADSIVSAYIKADPERGIAISSTPSMMAACDASLVRTLYSNLIDNAFKFTSGRKVTSLEFGSTFRNGKAGKQEIVYFVKDNGVGFDMADSDLVFKPFQRLHESDEHPGSGIGLSEAKRVVERHGGRIWLESVPESGTTVYFTLSPESA
ncbi:MAG: ATP-binding protein [Spirochaetes bacterium]|nr:ATP-binding protein [Spirochaetota bacterium]